MTGPKTKMEREILFRRFIKLRAQYPNMKNSEMCRQIGIDNKTLKNWTRIDDNEEQFLTFERPGGRKRITNENEDQNLRSLAKENNFNNIRQLRDSEVFRDNVNLSSASDNTIRSRLREKGIKRRVAAIKDHLRDYHKERRLTYANQMINWNFVDWSRVIFIDEFRISSGDCGKVYVWRENGTRYEEHNIHVVNNTFRFNVSFIVFFSFMGLGRICIIDTLNKETYANFLENYVMPYIAQHFDDGNVMLLHDNHPAHNSNFVQDWINENIGAVEDFVIPHPSLSPDMNPTENVGSTIKCKVRSQKPLFNSKEELLEALNNAYQEMTQVSWRPYFIKLIESMPRRIQTLQDVSGSYTRY